MKFLKQSLILLFGGLLASCASSEKSVADRILKGKPQEFSCLGYDGPANQPYKRRHRSFLHQDLQRFAEKPTTQRVETRSNGTNEMAAETYLPELIDQEFERVVDQALNADISQQRAGTDAQGLHAVDKPRTQELGILVLSGGGQWGAFGAGFLLDPRNRALREGVSWNYVTGISTGALQALFVGAEDYEGLAEAYSRKTNSDLATKNGLFAILRSGSLYETRQLRAILVAQLLGNQRPGADADARSGLLERIAKKKDSPHIFIGVVEARSGDFYEIDITRMVKDHYKDVAKRTKLAECVAGWALASSAVPVQLSPVAIVEGQRKTVGRRSVFLDGGVRNSTFIAPTIIDQELRYVARSIASEKIARRCKSPTEEEKPNVCLRAPKSSDNSIPPPHIYVIRNGPTIVPDDGVKGKVDGNPNVINTALRGYATLVNQNELSSISALLLQFPRRELNFVSADGYDWYNAAQEKCRGVQRDPNVYFDASFMRCLLAWGESHADHRPPAGKASGWRKIGNPNVCPYDERSTLDEGKTKRDEPSFCIEPPQSSMRALLDQAITQKVKALFPKAPKPEAQKED